MFVFHRACLLVVLVLSVLLVNANGVDGRKKKLPPTKNDATTGRKMTTLEESKNLLPVELTSKNFGAQVGDGNAWFIKFYAPWCSHCKEVAPTWGEVAVYFHEKPGKKIRVGKIDGDAERALISRFGVTAFPSFYLVKGYRVYEYDGNRDKISFVEFAEMGYKKISPIPFLSSPMGPLGLCQGLFLHLAYGAFNTLEWMQDDWGFSPFFSIMFLFGSIFIGLFITIVTAAITLTPKDKQD